MSLTHLNLLVYIICKSTLRKPILLPFVTAASFSDLCASSILKSCWANTKSVQLSTLPGYKLASDIALKIGTYYIPTETIKQSVSILSMNYSFIIYFLTVIISKLLLCREANPLFMCKNLAYSDSSKASILIAFGTTYYNFIVLILPLIALNLSYKN